MDPVINSLTQSSLVRSLKDVKPNSSSFKYGLKDNIPPFSMQKVVLKPYNNPSKTSQNATHSFKIPQYGHLNRAYLRIRTKNYNLNVAGYTLQEADYNDLFTKASTTPTVDSDYDSLKAKIRMPWFHECQLGTYATKGLPFGGGGTATISPFNSVIDPTSSGVQATSDQTLSADLSLFDPRNTHGDSSNAWNVLNVLDSITLKSNERIVEHVYGETIPAEVVKMNDTMRDFYIKGMIGYSGGDSNGHQYPEPLYNSPWDPSACHRDAYGRLSTDNVIYTHQVAMALNQHADFIVPVTLSSLKHLTKNLQTRVLENLELDVKMKELARGFNLESSPYYDDNIKNHEVELVLLYHNWHNNIESQLRNMNYKETIPSSLMLNSWFQEPGPFKVVSDSDDLVIPLTCKNVVSEIEIVVRSLNSAYGGINPLLTSLCKSKSDYTFIGRHLTYTVELRASGKTLWKATNVELQGMDSADYDLDTKRSRANDCAYGGKLEYKRGHYASPQNMGNVGYLYTPSPVYRRVSGAVANQSGLEFDFGDNMVLMRFSMDTTDAFFSGGLGMQTLDNPRLIITPPSESQWVAMEVEFNVYLKYYDISKINASTGRIVKSLNV